MADMNGAPRGRHVRPGASQTGGSGVESASGSRNRAAAQQPRRSVSQSAAQPRQGRAQGTNNPRNRVASQQGRVQATQRVDARTRPMSASSAYRQEGLTGYAQSNRQPVSTAQYGGRGGQLPQDPYSFSNMKKKKRSKAPFIVLSVVLVLIIAVAGVGFTAYSSAKELKGQASSVVTSVNNILDAVKAQDYAAASYSAQKVSDLSSDMVEELSSPLWTAATYVPVYGEDVKGIRMLVDALDDVSADALVPLTQSLEANPPDGLISSDKRINVEAVSQLLDAVETAAPAMQRCVDTVESLPEMHIEQINSMIAPATEKISGINDLFQKAASLAPLAESVLGANGDRTYLVVAQNSAEMRASGGFPGSMGTLRLQNGEIILDDFSKVYDVMSEETPAYLGITDVENNLFGASFMNVARDAGMDPDFTRVAEIWAAAFEEKNGTHVDGVVSVTPSVVQDILSIVGSVSLADGTTLDGSNATKVLQHDLYWKYLSGTPTSEGGDITDALFAQAADLAFEKLFAGLNSDTMMKFASCMLDGMKDRTVMFWLADDGEQAMLDDMDCSGALNDDPSKPEVGVFFSLWIGSKMGWYIDISNEILSSTKNADGSYTYQVRTTFSNTASQDEVSSAGDYIAGYLEGFDRGNLYPCLHIYAPAGGTITAFEATNGAQFSEAQHDGLQLYTSFRPDFRSGESIACTYTVTTSAEAEEELTFATTPTLTNYR